MPTILFAIPLKPGKLNAYKAFSKEITGPKKKEYADLLKRYGLKSAKVWHHTFGDKEYIMVLHDTEEDAQERLKNWSSSSHPFDRWFNEQILNCYDIKNFESMPPQPQFLYDFDLNR